MYRRAYISSVLSTLLLIVIAGCGGGASSSSGNTQPSSNPQSGVINITGTWTGEFVDSVGTLPGSTAQITEIVIGTTATLSGTFEVGIPGSLCGPITGTLSGSVVGTTVSISGNYPQGGGGTLFFNGQSNPTGTGVSGKFSLLGGCGSTQGTAIFGKS